MNGQESKKQDRLSFIFAATAVALVVFMLIFIPLNPLRKYRRSAAQVQTRRDEVAALVQVRDTHLERLRNQEILMKRLNDRPPNFRLWSSIIGVLDEERLRDKANLTEVAPKLDKSGATSTQVTMVELELTGVTLKELTNILHKVYSGNNLIVVYRMLLRPSNDDRGLECKVTFLTPNSGAVPS